MNPTPQEIKQARMDAGLTTAQAAGKIFSSQRSWQLYEASKRKMHPAIWWTFKKRTTRLRKHIKQARCQHKANMILSQKTGLMRCPLCGADVKPSWPIKDHQS